MIKNGYGRIINIGSIVSSGRIGQSVYSASKSGLHGLTRSMAIEMGRKNITCNCIEPVGRRETERERERTESRE